MRTARAHGSGQGRAHAFLFGYLSAVFAGFLLTAVPNWTGRLPVVGWPVAGLAAIWLAGRIAMALSGWLPGLLVALVDLSFLAAGTAFWWPIFAPAA